MANLFERDSYRAILQDELARRRSRNPGYSQRAFARDLGLRSNRLSEILRGKQGISEACAQSITERLGYSDPNRRYFCSLVRADHSRLKSERASARASARSQAHRSDYHTVQLDTFQVISQWYHLSLLELTKVTGFTRSVAWVAGKLSITEDEALDAIQRLKRLGMLEEHAGTWRLPQTSNTVPGGFPAESIKRFHEQFLRRAIKALRRQPIEERDFQTTLIALKKESLPEAKRRIGDFWRSLDKDLGAPSDADDVYCLGVQLFRVTEGTPS
jgi:uncharacterized protein (TIGR02147 family)